MVSTALKKRQRNGKLLGTKSLVVNESKDLIVVVDSDLRALIPEFLRSKRAHIAHTIHALEQGDYETAVRVGHQLKGEGAAFGFDQVTAMGAELELAATNADRCAALKWARALAEFLDHVEVRFCD
jgi:HPt (histidine-containing phosphotransfer) domain-containing protein